MKTYRIHPAIGVARVGNADRTTADGIFIGPEILGLPANVDPATGRFSAFKSQGKVKAQAARFRIWEYDDAGGMLTATREINLGSADVAGLEWQVTLANRKASFFEFDGQAGATNNFAGRPRRNASIPAAQRQATLEMEESGVIAGKSTPRKELRNTNASIPISLLGELRTDEAGRLLVLGGEGKSESWDRTQFPLDSYANNDGWFDDISDGSVNAKLTLRATDGTLTQVAVEGAWLLVGPPDFAPSVGNVVTLYDTMWNVAVQHVNIPANEAVFQPGGALYSLKRQHDAWQINQSLPADYLPSFTLEILPILRRALEVGWVHSSLGFDSQQGPVTAHTRFGPDEWATLADPAAPVATRNGIFRRLQVPGSATLWNGMPRTLGDEPYGGGSSSELLLSVTPIQYALLRKWKEGQFVNDPPFPGPALPAGAAVTPWGLDRAALENCVGGAFYPGIEASWLVRREEIYATPFRVQAGAQSGQIRVVPGFFSQQMALPWQADFMDCKKESPSDAIQPQIPASQHPLYAWWPAQRPDDAFVGMNATTMEPWARGLGGHEDMVDQWSTRGFVIANGIQHFETEGPPSSVPAPIV